MVAAVITKRRCQMFQIQAARKCFPLISQNPQSRFRGTKELHDIHILVRTQLSLSYRNYVRSPSIRTVPNKCVSMNFSRVCFDDSQSFKLLKRYMKYVYLRCSVSNGRKRATCQSVQKRKNIHFTCFRIAFKRAARNNELCFLITVARRTRSLRNT